MAKVAAETKPQKIKAFVATRIKPEASKPSSAPQSETDIRIAADKLSERSKDVVAKPVRIGVVIASAAQDKAINDAAALEAQITALKSQIADLDKRRKRILEPLCKMLDDRQRLSLQGQRLMLRAEPYEASVYVKVAGVTYRIRNVD